jgi:hypothetical protein
MRSDTQLTCLALGIGMRGVGGKVAISADAPNVSKLTSGLARAKPSRYLKMGILNSSSSVGTANALLRQIRTKNKAKSHEP